MTYIAIKDGETHYCEASVEQPVMIENGVEVQASPIRLGGLLVNNRDGMRLDLYRFDEGFHIADDYYLVVRSDLNWFASLPNIVSFGAGQHGFGEFSSHNQRFWINELVVGWQPWLQTYKVRRTNFIVPGADHLLRHSSKYRGIINSRKATSKNGDLLNCAVSGGRVGIRYTWVSDALREYPREVWPVLEMEFDEDLSLELCQRRVMCLLRFLSAANSMRFVEGEQTVSLLSRNQWREALERNENPPDWSVYYNRSEQDRLPLSEHGGSHGAFALNHDDAERDAFQACLVTWFARYPEWEAASSAMMEAFAMQMVMSAERLLNATRWIEATPGAEAITLLAKEHAGQLTKAIAAQAADLGYEKITADRLKGAIGIVGKEVSAERFSRMVGDLQGVFGSDVVGDDLAAWVAKAFSIRGLAAHRPIIGQTEAEYQTFSKATHAAECFAYLMLIKDLPMSDSGCDRVRHATFVAYYRAEIKGTLPSTIK